MSVRRIPVPVMKMQIAIIRMVPTAVPVDRDSLAMELLVTVNLSKILVSTSQSSMFWNCSHENTLWSIMEVNLWFHFCFTSDVDECSAAASVCDENANCTNTDGSYTCTCGQGYNGDGRTCQGK